MCFSRHAARAKRANATERAKPKAASNPIKVIAPESGANMANRNNW